MPQACIILLLMKSPSVICTKSTFICLSQVPYLNYFSDYFFRFLIVSSVIYCKNCHLALDSGQCIYSINVKT